MVCGATGAQGGSVVQALLKCNKYRIRAISRDCNSQEVKALESKGVEVLCCDFTKPDELKKALNGVEIGFFMTNFWDPEDRNREWEIGKLMVDCAKGAGIKHFIWSHSPNVEYYSKAKYTVPHFTDKAKVGEYALANVPSTLIMPASYYQNFDNNFTPETRPDGTLVYTLPKISSPLACFDVDDMGEAVACVAQNRDVWVGQQVPLVGDNLTLEEYVNTLKEFNNKKIELNLVSLDEYRGWLPDKVKELADMFAWVQEYGYFGPNVDLALGKKICPKLKSWRTFLEQSKINPS